MAIHYPARHLILPPLILVLSIPLAIFAWFTTTLAIAVLLCRVAVVYFEMAVIIIPNYFAGFFQLADVHAPFSTTLSADNSPPRRRRRPSIAPVDRYGGDQLTSPLRLSHSAGPARDYEGLGGWRLDGASDGEGPWSRSPVAREPPIQYRRPRHHHRSLTSGSVPRNSNIPRNRSDEAIMNSSRSRTPLGTQAFFDGNFPLEMGMGKRKRRKDAASSCLDVSKAPPKVHEKQA